MEFYDKRRFHPILTTRGGTLFSDGMGTVVSSLKNIYNAVSPTVGNIARDVFSSSVNKLKENAPKYIENKTRDFIESVLNSANKKETVRNFVKDTANELGTNFKDEVRNQYRSENTQNSIRQIKNDAQKVSKNEASKQALAMSQTLNNIISGRGLDSSTKRRSKRGGAMVKYNYY